nr:uncharacterized protein LOC127309990 [Lolium perenne]
MLDKQVAPHGKQLAHGKGVFAVRHFLGRTAKFACTAKAKRLIHFATASRPHNAPTHQLARPAPPFHAAAAAVPLLLPLSPPCAGGAAALPLRLPPPSSLLPPPAARAAPRHCRRAPVLPRAIAAARPSCCCSPPPPPPPAAAAPPPCPRGAAALPLRLPPPSSLLPPPAARAARAIAAARPSCCCSPPSAAASSLLLPPLRRPLKTCASYASPAARCSSATPLSAVGRPRGSAAPAPSRSPAYRKVIPFAAMNLHNLMLLRNDDDDVGVSAWYAIKRHE